MNYLGTGSEQEILIIIHFIYKAAAPTYTLADNQHIKTVHTNQCHTYEDC